jgi:hypothetical protein
MRARLGSAGFELGHQSRLRKIARRGVQPAAVVPVGLSARRRASPADCPLLQRHPPGMPPTLGDWLVSRACPIEDPEAPSKTREVDHPEELAECIDALLARARDWPQLADLPRRLEAAAATLQGDTLIAGELLAAVKALGEGFENFLQLIAAAKYADRPDLLNGDTAHVGFMHSALGSLLLGTPTPQRGATEDDKRAIPKATIVRFQFGSKELGPRIYDRVRLARNEVHAARELDPYRLLRDARHMVAAYVLAADENRRHLARALAPHRAYLEGVVSRGRNQLPFVVEPTLELAVGSRKVIQLDELVDLVSATPYRLTITGDPGAGKTTLMRAIAGRIAERKLAASFSELPLPVYVEASRYAAERPFAEHIAAELGLDDRLLEEQWAGRRLVVCLDGVNEIPARLLREALLDVERLQGRFPAWSIILTSRFHRLPGRLEFEGMRLLPFDDAQMLDYLRRAYGDDQRADEFAAQLDGIPRLRQLCRNPLLLHMLVDISGETFRVPDNRGELLHEFMSRFLDREREAFLPTEPLTLQTVLAHLAFSMRERRAVALGERETHRLVAAAVAGLQSGVGTVDVVSAAVSAHLLHRVGSDQLAFFHELVQEYFAALRLVDRFESGHDLPEGVGSDPWWEEVVVLAYGLSKESERLLGAIQRASVTLSARSVLDAPVPSSAGLESVVQGARTELARGVQHEALQVLTMVWTESAQRSLLADLPSASGIADVLMRFREDPFASATELLGIADTEESIRGIAAVAHRVRASQAARLRLGDVLADRLSGWSARRHAPIRAGDVPRLCHAARFTETSARIASAAVSRILSGTAASQMVDATKWIRLHTIASDGAHDDATATAWREHAARMLLGGNLAALAEHLSSGTVADRRWLMPFLPALQERHGAEVDVLFGWLSDSRASAVPRPDVSPVPPTARDADVSAEDAEASDKSDNRVVAASNAAGLDESAAAALQVESGSIPTAGEWERLGPDQRARFLNLAAHQGRFIEVLESWPPHLVLAFKEYVLSRLPDVRPSLAEAVWEFIGIPDKGESLADARIAELMAAGDRESALKMATRWNRLLPTSTEPRARPASVHDLTPNEIVAALASGDLLVVDAEQWLLGRTRQGRAEDVLPIAYKVRSALSGAAAVAVAECLEAGQEVFAGQLINVFNLEDAFADALPRLAPVLMAAGKSGLAMQFASMRSPSVTAVNRAAVERIEQAVREGQFAKAIQIVRTGGFGYLENDLRRLIGAKVEELNAQRDAAGLAALVEVHDVWWFVDAAKLYRALTANGVLLKARVRAITGRRGVALLEMAHTADRVTLSRALSPRVYSRLARGCSVYVSIRQQGVELHAAAVREAQESDPATVIVAPPAQPEAPSPGPQPDVGGVEGLEALSRRWGARLRRS